MAVTVSKKFIRRTGLMLVTSLLIGCGLTQTVKDGTVSMTQSIFYKQIKTLRLDFIARSELNDDEQTPLAAVVRIYQLKSEKAFEQADYDAILKKDSDALKEDILAEKDLTLLPGGSLSLTTPLETEAKFVAVAGLFRQPDSSDNRWRIVIKREELEADKARTLEVGEGSLTLLPLKE